jgi:hypothetical protein
VTTAVLLWAAIAVFLLRVLAQIEALLLVPDWLPPMDAWYSGLLPYPVLLPAQILLLMLMAVLAYRRSVAPGVAGSSVLGGRAVRAIAVVYFVVMVVRLALTLLAHGADFYLHGGIPIAFHWVLALFLLVFARSNPRRSTNFTNPR